MRSHKKLSVGIKELKDRASEIIALVRRTDSIDYKESARSGEDHACTSQRSRASDRCRPSRTWTSTSPSFGAGAKAASIRRLSGDWHHCTGSRRRVMAFVYLDSSVLVAIALGDPRSNVRQSCRGDSLSPTSHTTLTSFLWTMTSITESS